MSLTQTCRHTVVAYSPPHRFALTSSECDRLIRDAGPCQPEPGRPDDTPKATAPDWLYSRLVEPAAEAGEALGLDIYEWNFAYGKVLEYAPGKSLEWHTDAGFNQSAAHVALMVDAGMLEQWQVDEMNGRRLSVMLQLSDAADYVGGGLQVRSADGVLTTARRERGSVSFISATTEHSVTRIVSGCRKSAVVFIGTSPRGT